MCQRSLFCLHVYWFWSCLFCRVRFFVRLVLSDSVCRDILCSEMVKTLCTSELIVDCFCAGWWCNLACRYLSVDFLYTWWPKVLSILLETITSRKGIFFFLFFSISSEVDIWMLTVEENKKFTEFGSAVFPRIINTRCRSMKWRFEQQMAH